MMSNREDASRDREKTHLKESSPPLGVRRLIESIRLNLGNPSDVVKVFSLYTKVRRRGRGQLGLGRRRGRKRETKREIGNEPFAKWFSR